MNSTTTAPGGTTHVPPPPPAASFFAAIRNAGLVRTEQRLAAGVGAALARRWGIDPILVRVGFVVLCLFGGLGLVAYAVGWLLLPSADGRIHVEEALAGRFTAGAVGGLIALLIGLTSVGPAWSVGEGGSLGGLIALASLVLVILVLLYGFGVIGQRSGRGATSGPVTAAGSGATRVDLSKPAAGGPAYQQAWTPGAYQPPAPPQPPRPAVPRRRGPGSAGTTLVAGLALLAAGAVVAARDELPASAHLETVAWAAALAVLALALVALGAAGRRSGGIGWLAVGVAVVATVQSVGWGGGDPMFDRNVAWTPTTTISSVNRFEYQMTSGNAVLDLTELDLDTDDPRVPQVSADLAFGKLRVLVPDDLVISIDTAVGVGELDGAQEGSSSLGGTGRPDLELDLNVGIGRITIEEVSR